MVGVFLLKSLTGVGLALKWRSQPLRTFSCLLLPVCVCASESVCASFPDKEISIFRPKLCLVYQQSYLRNVLVAHCKVGGLVSLNTERVKIGRVDFCTCRTEALLTHGFTLTVTASKGGRENGRAGQCERRLTKQVCQGWESTDGTMLY